MNFCWSTLTVSDIEKSSKFYKNIIGLKELRTLRPNEEMTIMFLKDNHNFNLELIENKKNDEEKIFKGITLAFRVDSLDESIEDMKNKNIDIVRGPIKVSKDTKFFFIKDPDGLEIQIVESNEL
ncbi:VOC family protein [Clostridium sardiniense]|uniref:VOC family protein n=1 Tax=Clostridium sardiniense TaxID=29369 RepID=A0ABS7L206_CLOSR|nr:VOC family protein [Clostridium sardiniense]MBY0756873.1 VOC family protein [Clostridium sardiniense]MDQ0458718.1 lactoylglutathione lyase [Clostridium sardiniense]